MSRGFVDRREFLRKSVAGIVVPGSVASLIAVSTQCSPDGSQRIARTDAVNTAGRGSGGYGPLNNDQEFLLLPEGFQLRAFGAIGDPLSDGGITPVGLDGMAAFAAGPDRVRLVRNHEERNGPNQPIGSNPYDPAGGGGTVTLELDRARNLVRDFVSLSGTTVNCAGGPTPWGSWLSCEETVAGPGEGYEKTHGWVFEVPATANAPVTPVPLVGLGRFSHEAVAVDPRTGIVYETEDHLFPPGSGFYRYLPNQPGELAAGGRLQMAMVRSDPKLEIFRGSEIGINVGDTFEIAWVDLDLTDPGDDGAESDRISALFLNGYDKGAAVFARLEGCFFADDSVFFHDTVGGAAGEGHVWQYVPGEAEGQGGDEDTGLLRLIFESPGREVLDHPDNVTVSPRGGIVICEDGSGTQYVRGLTRDGRIFDLAANQLNNTEFAGATFSPDGETLFVNIQGPTRGQAADRDVRGEGVTLAIWGPWSRGAL